VLNTVMKPFKKLLKFEEARKIILSEVSPIERKETIPLIQAERRVLAENIISSRDIPPFSRASMDGYAVKAGDTFAATRTSPVCLFLERKIFAGEVGEVYLEKGKCMEIATGAPIPPGSDAVVMVENTRKKGNKVAILKPVYPGENIAVKGEDIKKDERVLRKGDFLIPAKIGVIAALGIDRVTVYQSPRILLIPTGGEIVPPGRELKPGQIYDINSYTLSSLIRECSGEVRCLPSLPDEESSFEKVIPLFPEYDLVIFTGGSSVGERDLLPRLFSSEEGEIIFHGIQIKPGKPVLFGKFAGKPVLGIPGYPASCLTAGYLLLKPVIEKMAQRKFHRIKIRVKMAETYFSSLGRHQFLPVRVENNIAYTVFKESGDITSLSRADGYIQIPENQEIVEEGDEVEVTLW